MPETRRTTRRGHYLRHIMAEGGQSEADYNIWYPLPVTPFGESMPRIRREWSEWAQEIDARDLDRAAHS